MVCSRPIFTIITAFFLISLILVSGHADTTSRSCMILVTSTSGGSVQPDGAISVPYGSDITLTFTPSSGYMIQKILVDGSDAGQYPSISLSPIVHDTTVHAIFAPEGRTRSGSGSSKAVSSPVSPGLVVSSPDLRIRTEECTGLGCTPERAKTVGSSGADYTRIQDAIANASPGDTIYIESGTYNEQIIINKKLSLIGLQGDAGKPLISSDGIRSTVTISADDVIIGNLSVTNTMKDSGDSAAIRGGGLSNVTVENCVISDSEIGIQLDGSEGINIRDCNIQNISQTGLLLTSLNQSLIKRNAIGRCRIGVQGIRVSGLSFRDNLISLNLQHGAIFKNGLNNTEFSGNRFAKNGQKESNIEMDDDTSAWYLENADNVTIAGNTLIRNQGTALTLNETVRLTITNNTLQENYAGVTFSGTIPNPGHFIDSSNMIDGLPVIYYEEVSGGMIEDISPSILYLQNCSNMTIRGLEMKSRNGFGILVKGGGDITISNCSVKENLYQNILISEVTGGNVTGSEISNGSQYGIGLINTTQFGVSDSIVRNNVIGVAVRGNTSFVNVKGNILESNDVGFQAENISTIFGFGTNSANRITGGRIGLSSLQSNGGIFTGNTVAGVQEGIRLMGSDSLYIEDNRIEALDTGIMLSGVFPENNSPLRWHSFGNSVKRNSFSAGNYPIRINDTRVFGNFFFLNDFITIPGVLPDISPRNDILPGPFSWAGVFAPASLESAISNQTSLPDGGKNFWDTGERVRYSYNGTTFSGYLGNHWSNYSGSEIGTSGVGDLPVQINPGNEDTYPLIESWNQYLTQGSGYHLELYPGWNFISTPSVLASGSDTARIFEVVDTRGHSMYSFNNSTWKPMKGEDLIAPLHGYWIFSGTGASVPLSFDPGIIPVPLHLTMGWNAIGYPGIQQAAARDALSSLDTSWSYAVGYDAYLQTYEKPIMQETDDSAIMYPSQGYWLYMNQEWDLQPVTG